MYTRAFNEVDWDTRIEEERERMRMEKYEAKRAAKAVKKAKAPLRVVSLNILPTPAESIAASKEELETAALLEAATYALIPLEPTLTARLLPLNPPATSATHTVLPLTVIASLHASHGTHALQVSTLFARLDVVQVFDDLSVHCEARSEPSGVCTTLEVRFEGWTANEVRGILGRAGGVALTFCTLDFDVW